MLKKPTDKQVTAMTYLADNPSATVTDAMRAAGYTESTIQHPGQNFIGLPSVQSAAESFQVKLDKRINSDRIISKLDKLMDAQKVVSAVIVGKDADSRTNDFIEVDDAPTQLKATQLVMQAKQLFGSIANQTNVQVNLNGLKDQYKKGE